MCVRTKEKTYGRSRTILGLDNLITTELDALHESIADLARDVLVVGLGEEGDDGDTGVTTNNGDVLGGGVGLLDLGDEAGSANEIEGGDTEEALGVVDTSGLEDLGGDGNGGVDRVGDDQDVGVGRVLSSGLGQIADDRGVGVEKIYACVNCRSFDVWCCGRLPSRVMPGLRGTPAGMRTTSAPLRAEARPAASGW